MMTEKEALSRKFSSDAFNLVDINKISRIDQISGKPTTFIKEVFRRFFKNPWAVICFVIFVTILLLAIYVPLVSPASSVHEITAHDLGIRLRPIWINGGAYEAKLTDQLFKEWYGTDDAAGKYREIFIGEPKLVGGTWIATINPYKSKSLLDSLNGVYPILGTDNHGADIWTKSWYGTAQSLQLSISVALVSVAIGAVYGAISGSFAGKWVDTVMMRIIDILSGIPTILWLIILSTIYASFGQNADGSAKEVSNIVIFFSLITIFWMGPAVLTRTYILKNKDAEYIQAIKTLGGSQSRIIFQHMLPNISGRLLVRLVHMIPSVIFFEASLVFLGFKSPFSAGLGTLISNNYTDIEYLMPLIFPSIIIVLLTLSLQIVANALNDAVDPRVSEGK